MSITIDENKKTNVYNNILNRKTVMDNTKSFGECLEVKNSEYYEKQLKNMFPSSKINVKAMTAADVDAYYKKWKDKPVNLNGFYHEITVSPVVLDKMSKDPKYASEMMMKIQAAAIPQGFDKNTIIYEYKVIVRDDGEIEVLCCAGDREQKKSNPEDKKDRDKKKVQQQEVELMRFLFDSLRLKPVSSGRKDVPLENYEGYIFDIDGQLKLRKKL